MHKLILTIASIVFTLSLQAFAEEPVAVDSGANAQLKVDDTEPTTDFNKAPPSKKTKSQLKKPKIGFKTTVKPEDMKSYNRSESGDISAQ